MIDKFDYDAAREFIQQKSERKKRKSHDLYIKAKKESEDIIEVIKKKFSVKRIYQWGSILSPERFDENSDIDIAIEGLDSVEDFFELYGIALNKTSFPLDLIEMEKIDKLNRNSIIENGKLIYER